MNNSNNILNVTATPPGGWTRAEIEKRMDDLLNQMMDAAKYGEKTVIEEETSKLEIDNLYKTLNDAWSFLNKILASLPTNQCGGGRRIRRKLRLDYDI